MLRYTIKDLLFLTIFVAVAAAALRYGGDFWMLTLSSCLLFGLMIATVVMFVDRGRRQAMATGFVACVVIYQAALLLPGAYAWLPTMTITEAMPEAYRTIRFYEIAYLLWSLLFGYLGACLARWVYSRRIAAESPPT